MNIIKSAILFLVISFSSLAFAGNEDWTGKFYLLNTRGETSTIIHNKNGLDLFGFMHIGKRFSFSKGSSLNGFVASENGVLEVEMNIQDFTREVSKLGTVTNKEIAPGSTYHE